MGFKALVTENIDKKADLLLKEIGLGVKRVSQAPSATDMLEILKSPDFRVLCSRSRTQITEKILSESHLDCIGAFCIGVNQIDSGAACKKGIPVFNAPFGNTRSVAEMVIGLIIGLSRSLFFHNRNMHQGKWVKFTKNCFEIRGKTLGIIGYGHIGTQLSILAESLGMKVIYYDITGKLPLGNAKVCFTLKELLSHSDFVSLHVPETESTKNMMQKEQLKFMKPGAFIINTSRGKVVNIKDLKSILKNRKIAGAALDVYPKEPKVSLDSFSFPLQELPNVVLTPHVGGSTEEAQQSIVQEVCKRLKDFLKEGSIQNSVNFPNLLLPPIVKGTTRITNIHKNQPGVLGSINELISHFKVNIKSQYLATNEHIGYVVMDLEKNNITKLSKEIAKKISSLETSIKTRIL